jgi:hypothetical protein
MPILNTTSTTFPLVRHHVGLEATQGLPNGGPTGYTTVFFGASREYADEEGWIKVRNGRSNNRRNNNSNNRR